MSSPLTYLVASPHLRGEIFDGIVILLLEHDEIGAMGLIVNAPMNQKVSELIPNAADQHLPAWLGGPVEPTLGWCLYSKALGLINEMRLVQGLYLSNTSDALNALIKTEQFYMLILGYTGWGAGQLAEESKQGAWVWVEQTNPDLIWEVPPEKRWIRALESLGIAPKTIMPGGAQA